MGHDIHKQRSHSRILVPFPSSSSSLGRGDQKEMARRQRLHPSSGSSGRQATEDGASPDPLPAFIDTQLPSEDWRRRPVPSQPTMNYPPGYLPPQAARSSDVFFSGGEESGYTVPQGFTSLDFPPPMTQLTSYGPGGVHDTSNAFAGRQGLNGRAVQIPHSVAGPDRGIPRVMISPEAGGQHPHANMHRHRHRNLHERPDLRRPGSNYTQHSNEGTPANVRGPQPSLNNYASTSGNIPRQNHFPVMDMYAFPGPTPTQAEYPRTHPRPTMLHNTPIPRGPPVETQSRRRNPHAEARVNLTQQGSDIAPISAGPSRDRTYAAADHLHSHSNRGVGHSTTELPPNPRSDGPPSQPTRVRGHGSSSKSKHTVGQGSAPGQTRTHTRRSGPLPGSTAEGLPGSSAARRSTHAALILQTPYTCRARQDTWVRQPPIRFGGVKLTDAADPGYLGIPGHNDRVLNYEGVGSSISSRLVFSEGEIGKWKVLTTNHKKDREFITKKKLAFEISKFVRDHVEQIRDETGCYDITFENIVLTRLFHVSKASWQPELWYEVPVRGSAPF